jgi:hypothetical protein
MRMAQLYMRSRWLPLALLASGFVGSTKTQTLALDVQTPPVPVASASPASPAPQPVADACSQLANRLRNFRRDNEALRKLNSTYSIGLGLLAIALSVGVVIAGWLDHGKLAALLGALLTVILGAQRIFPVGQRADFYRILVSTTDGLLTETQFRCTSAEQLEKLVDDFKTVQKYAGEKFPSDGNAEATKQLITDLKSK